jgi:hypothetical protein
MTLASMAWPYLFQARFFTSLLTSFNLYYRPALFNHSFLILSSFKSVEDLRNTLRFHYDESHH